MHAQQLIHRLELKPHPEGGWYREWYRAGTRVLAAQGERSCLTSIYYLLEQSQRSRWHVVDAEEVWHFYEGAALELLAYAPGSQSLTRHVLGDASDGASPAAVIESGVWQAARSLGDFSLVGCSVAPGFEFKNFHLVADLAEQSHHFEAALRPWQDLR